MKIEEKAREFNCVSMLKLAHDSSNDNYLQLTFNPRVDLIEKRAYEELQAKYEKLQNEVKESHPNNFYGYKKDQETIKELQQKLDICTETLKAIDQPLCELIIDDCGFEAIYEEQGTLANIVETNSDKTEEILNIVREALKKIKGE